MKRQVFGIVILCLVSLTQGFAQTGILKGKITDSKTGEELIGAAVIIEGTTTGTTTNFTGNYIMPAMEPGVYTIRCQYISYEAQVKEGIVIKDGEETSLNFLMGESLLDLAEVKVVAKANRESENLLMLEQKKAVVATQAVGAQELSRKGVSDAQGAVSKVSGISKQEGVKNVFVRGLGDRYNATTYNGLPIPSEDPEYKNISLDFFSTDIIQSVGVNKVFNAANYGDVGGAVIDINSKELYKDSEFTVDLGLGVNTQTFNREFLQADGVNAFGYTQSTNLPTPPTTPLPGAQFNQIDNYNFTYSLDPSSRNTQVNGNFGLSGGKKFYLGDKQNTLSLFAVGSYSNDYAYSEAAVRRITTDGTIDQNQVGDKYTQNTSHLVMANADYTTTNKSTIAYNFMYLHTTNQYVGDFYGTNSDYEAGVGQEGMMRRQQLNDNALYINQITSNWFVNDKLDINAAASYNLVLGKEPDRRINNLEKRSDGHYGLQGGNGKQQRFFSDLNEGDMNVKVSADYKLSDEEDSNSLLSIGYTGRFVNHDFESVEYDMRASSDGEFYPPNIVLDDFFNQENMNIGDGNGGDFRVLYSDQSYSVARQIHGGFADATIEISPRFILNAGLRFDQVNMDVTYNKYQSNTPEESNINEFFILPSFNTKYDLNDKNALRLGLSKTYTLPQSKEISPFRYNNLSYTSQGNKDLQPSENYNLDLKWDNYLSAGELLSVNTFYKRINQPISRINANNSAGVLTYENVADFATVAGLELELRKNIFNQPYGVDANGINKLSFGLNGSYIYSNIDFDNPDSDAISGTFTHSTSQLEGAAPIIANIDLTHTLKTGNKAFSNALVFNYTSQKVFTIGRDGFNPIMESAVPTMDFVSSAKLNQHMTIKFKAQNLLNPKYQLTQKPIIDGQDQAEVTLLDFEKGMNISIGFSYTF
ncbi:TonB-dependent receptor domain-containing protein [Carboxylicivirga sp. M1479]|uniref:TonB-dependent receptor domain-containing protein n=1 Tax=Carboxylicivirga sp. M1479 TaxID=2594476 RepID=UPI0011785D34|nr:TonB-dependent receptor [Carboxylicivirga sp. M1479]TRX72195.1 TonB-dependent receptor [Carboxylicivirga sp. M1479]